MKDIKSETMSKHTIDTGIDLLKRYKICGENFHKVHLKNKGDDKTLCGRPQENYDTVEGLYTLDEAKAFHTNSVCKKCKSIAEKSKS